MTSAAFSGHLETSERLLQAGADPLASAEDEVTPLHWSVIGANPRVFDLVAAYAGDSGLDRTTASGDTLLHLACGAGLDMVEAVLHKVV